MRLLKFSFIILAFGAGYYFYISESKQSHRSLPLHTAANDICVVGDTGYGLQGKDPEDVGQYRVAEAMFEAGCRTLLHTGDVSYHGKLRTAHDENDPNKENPIMTRSFREPYQKLIDSGARFYITLGNHDYRYWYDNAYIDYAKTFGFATIQTPEGTKKHQFFVYPNHTYAFRLGVNQDICVWAINTEFIKRAKYRWLGLASRQYSWLKENIATAKNCRWRVLVGHRAFVSSLRKNLEPHESLPLVKLLQNSLDIYLAGHSHVLEDAGLVRKSSNALGFYQIVSGAGGEPEPAECNTAENSLSTGCRFLASSLGFVKVRFEPDRATWSFIDVNGNVLKSFSMKVRMRQAG